MSNMNTPLISVIVPVYKVEAYLDRCVQSIVDQTYQNLEIILVDDGSPDNCPAMCDAWAAKDSRIKVIHKENGGLSDARNAGMAVAKGEFVGFVDSDDYIRKDMYQLLWERLSRDGSDIAACGVEMVWEYDTPSQRLTPNGTCVLEKDAALEACIRESWLKQPVWYKLYRADLIRDLPFPVGKYHEDVFWTWQAIARAEQVSVFDDPCYYYIQRSDSIMAERYSLRRLDAIEAKQQRLQFLETTYPHLAELGRKDLLFSCMYHGQLAMKDLDNTQKKTAFTKLQASIQSCSGSLGTLNVTHKAWSILAKLNLELCCKIRNHWHIGL